MTERPTARELLLEMLAYPRGDCEAQHSNAESALCAYLRSIGDKELADAWEAAQLTQTWWYA